MTPEEALFVSIGEQLKGTEQGQLFGKPCFKTHGKAFICFFQNEMVFKLTGAVRTEALALDGSQLFDPSGKKRPMKEWIQVTALHQDKWSDLAQEALKYVEGNHTRMQ
jgi:hypothetical protein